MNTAICITAIIVAGIVAIVALSQYHLRKTTCKHKWKIIDSDVKEFYRERPSLGYSSRYNLKIYTLQCDHCGEVRMVTDEELTQRFRNKLSNC